MTPRERQSRTTATASSHRNATWLTPSRGDRSGPVSSTFRTMRRSPSRGRRARLRSRPWGSMNSSTVPGEEVEEGAEEADLLVEVIGRYGEPDVVDPGEHSRALVGVRRGSRAASHRRRRGSSLTNTWSPDGAVIPGNGASASPRVVATAGQSSALARSATPETGAAVTPMAAETSDSFTITCAPPLRHRRTGLVRWSPTCSKPRPSIKPGTDVSARRARDLEEGRVNPRRGWRGRHHEVCHRVVEAGEPVLEEEQRSHGRPRGPAGIGLAYDVAEDLQRQRASVARLQHCGHHALDVEAPLSREAAVVTTPLEHVHVEQWRVGDLQEADPLARDAVERGAVVAAGEHVEGVDRQGHRRMVCPSYDVPGLPDPVDVPPPRQRLERDGDAVLGSELAHGVQLLGGEIRVGDRAGRGVRADQHRWRPEVCHHAELGPHAVEDGVEAVRVDALDVAQGLEQVDGEPQVRTPRRHLDRRHRRGDEVVVEELDAVEAGVGDRRQLLVEHSAEGDGRDPLAHQAVSSAKCAVHPLRPRRAPREQLEGTDGLLDRHAAARHHPAPAFAGGTQELGVEREVDDVGDPAVATQQ